MGVEKIWRRMVILIVRLQKEGKADISLAKLVKKGKSWIIEARQIIEPEQLGGKKIKYPTLLMFTGYGIICKTYGEEQAHEAQRITQDKAFIWETRPLKPGGQTIAFTRQERVAALLGVLRRANVPIVHVHVGTVALDTELGPECLGDTAKIAMLLAAKFRQTGIAWKELARLDEQGRVLTTLVTAHIRLPLLVCLLGLLLINYCWCAVIREKYVVGEAERTLLEKDHSSREKLSNGMQQMIYEFSAGSSGRYAPLLDEIAALIPVKVKLHTLLLNPLLKSPEDHRPPEIREREIELTGETPEPECITLLTGRLATCDSLREVKLIFLDKNRDTERFDFKIRIWL